MNNFQLLIGGRLEDGSGSMDVVNPATEKPFAAAPVASEDQIDRAIAAARNAFDAWRETPFAERRDTLSRVIDAIASDRDELARLLTLEQGKPLSAAMGEVDTTLEYMRYFAGLDIPVEVIAEDADRKVEIHRVALGPVAAIVPWNYPLLLMAFKLPPALLAGNTVVLKPAPTTPLSALRFGALVADIVPPGVINVIAGGDEVGPRLTSDPRIAKISFTGSTATGHLIMASAASNLTRITLELGGNDPALILPDSDLEKVMPMIFAFAFGNSGQVCRAIKRVYVPRPMMDKAGAILSSLCGKAMVGDGMGPDIQFGPVQNAQQYQRVLRLFEAGASQGCVLPGGGPVKGAGYFFRPTVIAGVPNDNPLVLEEQFGPVIPLVAYDDMEEAIQLANSGSFGLAASVWGNDSTETRRIAGRLDAGTVWINKHGDRLPNLPIAGAKHSGIGVELGQLGLLEYTQIKVINQAI
ncbi:MAG: aldehyde dehydrogenase family protein [Thiothrix sp.]|nr:aldehyde dehydrogenase family protein [Thiothrix sp.]HPQ94082.1 aldehyde dehydrogenase family protein [Thiolinea sp.]